MVKKKFPKKTPEQKRILGYRERATKIADRYIHSDFANRELLIFWITNAQNTAVESAIMKMLKAEKRKK